MSSEDLGLLIQELADYVGFSEKDLEILRRIAPDMEPHISEMADLFYRFIQRNPEATRVLQESGAPIERLKNTLQEWARSLFTQPRDKSYAERRLAIGERHVRIGLKQKYVLGAMNVIRLFFQKRIVEKFRPHPEEVCDVMESVHRALDLDLNLICESYFSRSMEIKETERQKVEERLEDFLDRANVLVVGINRKKNITLFNRTFEKLSGWNRKEVLGKEYGPIFLPSRIRQTVEKKIRSFMEGRSLDPTENAIQTRDGKERLIRWFPSVTRDAHGHITEVIGIGQDITEVTWLQRQAAEREKAAAVGVLAAGVAHEVGNPLNSILAVTQSLNRRLKDASVRADLRIVAEEVSRASRTLQQMTHLARPVHKAMEELNINTVVISALDLIRMDRRARNHTILQDLDFSLPKTWAHKDELFQVFLNLLLNALDALEGREGKIEVRSSREGDRLHINILDTGCGIPKDKIPQLFEAFYSTKSERKGTGLGLWVSRDIVQRHGGTISISSVENTNTTASILLPIRTKPL